MTIIADKINFLWLDVETTGLDPVRNDIIQMACIPVVNGTEDTKHFNEFCQPFDWKTVDDKALSINNISRDQLYKAQAPSVMVDHFIAYCKQYGVKFTIAGYNAEFDRNFLSNLFKKCSLEKEFNEIFTADLRDTYKRIKSIKAQLPTANVKLATLCAHFNIAIKAHDALSDISATMKLDKIISDMLGDEDISSYITEHKVDSSLQLKEPVQLHMHSKYSFTDSLSSVSEIVEWCIKTGTPGFSVVDHGNAASLFEMTKIPDIIKSINKKTKSNHASDIVQGIPGTGLYIKHNESYFYLNAWAISNTGYKNIVKLASEGWTSRITISQQEFPVLSLEQVFAKKDGIVFGVPGINGPFTDLIVKKNISGIKDLLLLLNDNLDIRLELAAIDVFKYFDSNLGFMSYGIEGANMQKAINKMYWILANTFNIKCIPVSDSHYLDHKDKVIHDCVSRNAYKDQRHFLESRHQLNSNEIYTILQSHLGNKMSIKDYLVLVNNTYDIATLAQSVNIKHDFHLPKIEISQAIKDRESNYDNQTYMHTLQKIKEHGRWNNSPEYVERFKKEIDVIMKNETLNFLPYFLVYEDVCTFARSCDLLQGIARGSAGGSLLSYYLKIIHIDPVASKLPFERFLSHARIRTGSFPDIDLDIADRARPMVMKFLQEKYKLGFAQVSTFQKVKTKNAIKDAMATLYGRNRNDFEVKTICDLIPDSPQGLEEWDFLYGYVDQEGIAHKGQIESNEMLNNFFQQRPEIEDMVKRLIGSIRSYSRHASAFVISTIDLADGRVPTMIMTDKDLGDILVTQFDAPMVEKSGLVKADILGLKTLTMTSDCIKLIKSNHNVDFMEEVKGVPLVYRLPDEDERVFSDFYRRDTDSSFQFNSGVIKKVVADFTPTKKEHLSIMTALMRPGAMDAQMDIGTVKNRVQIQKTNEHVEYLMSAADFYISVRKGSNEAFYIHPDLAPILESTYGVIVYQEQVMQILVEICGYSLEETDTIRSAIAKKKHEVIMEAFKRIRESTAQRGWSEAQANALCQQIQAFSRYSFNKSHSHAYAELGYITMYLKQYYPLEWWCGVLNNEDDADKIRSYIVKLADKVSPPSLTNPSKLWSINNGKLIAPISAIKGIGPSVVDELVAKGPFQNIEDYIERVNHSKANIGAMSAFIKSRAADDMMDHSIVDYIERRIAFMNKYTSLRKSKTTFKPEMFTMNYLSIFLNERELNGAFNKSLLSSPDLTNILLSKWPGLRKTGSKLIPLALGRYNAETQNDDSTYIVPDIKSAEMMLSSGSDKEFGLIGLFQESSFASGISKKSGKPWQRLSVTVSDGYNTMECTWWDRTKPLRFEKNSVIFLRGIFKPGWRTPVSMQIKEIERVE